MRNIIYIVNGKNGVTFITTQCVEILPSYILKFIVIYEYMPTFNSVEGKA